jgi:FkbM family methyltransferase
MLVVVSLTILARSNAFGRDILNEAPWFQGPIGTPPECEHKFGVKRACKTFEGAFFCGMEWDEWNLVRGVVRSHNVVLELGGRFGTTSCVLAEQTGNSGNVVSVEPDLKVHRQLIHNRNRHNCSFHILQGIVGDTPIAMSERFGHYATQTRLAHAGEKALPSMDLRTLEMRIAKKFDTLLIDCEGCIDLFFLGSNRRLLNQVSMVIMEEDAPAQTDYYTWHHKLRRHGFERVWKVRDSFDPGAYWSRNVSHSVWTRDGLNGLPTCSDFAGSTKLAKRWLDCMDPRDDAPMVPGCSTDPCFKK